MVVLSKGPRLGFVSAPSFMAPGLHPGATRSRSPLGQLLRVRTGWRGLCPLLCGLGFWEPSVSVVSCAGKSGTCGAVVVELCPLLLLPCTGLQGLLGRREAPPVTLSWSREDWGPAAPCFPLISRVSSCAHPALLGLAVGSVQPGWVALTQSAVLCRGLPHPGLHSGPRRAVWHFCVTGKPQWLLHPMSL